MRRQRADSPAAIRALQTREAGHSPEIDEQRRRRQPQLHQRDQRMATGQQLGVLATVGQRLDRLLHRGRGRVLERRGNHAAPPSAEEAACIASHTRSGDRGMSIHLTPSGRESIEHGRGHGGRGRDRPGLADSLYAQRVHRRWGLGPVGLEHRYLGRGGDRIVDERARHELPVGVVMDALVQRLSDRVHDPAVHLPVDQHRIDRRAAVVDRDVLDDLHLARLGIDLDHARVRSEREHEVLRVVERCLLEPRLDVGWQLLGRDVGGERDVGHRLGLVRASRGPGTCRRGARCPPAPPRAEPR